MSFHQQNFNAFIYLIQNQASLFSAQDWANLSERATNLRRDKNRKKMLERRDLFSKGYRELTP